MEHSEESVDDAALLATTPEFSDNSLPWGMPGPYTGVIVRNGPLRGDFSTLRVNTDIEAVGAWLAEKASGSPHTATSYRREAERLILWASNQLGKSLSELAREDFLHFERFLENPQPRKSWVMQRRYPRTSESWRPFLGPLSPDSRLQSQKILYSLMTYLVNTGWFRANPMPAPKARKIIGFQPQLRSLSPDQWASVWREVTNQSTSTNKDALLAARERWIMAFFHEMGPRISEACSAVMGDICPDPRGEGWDWHLQRKGGQSATLPLPYPALEELWRFREALNLSIYPSPGETIPLIPSFATITKNGEVSPEKLKRLSKNQSYRLVVEAFRRTADRIENDNAQSASRLRLASTHWLRHTALRELADSTEDLRMVQMLGGHADINMSALYARQDSEALRKALNKRSSQ